MEERVKIVVFVPVNAADAVREALAEAGAGKMGNYSHGSFSATGIGRFKPLEGAHPAIGSIGKQEEVAEERIETFCGKKDVVAAITAVKAVHPYEEPVIEITALLTV